MLLLFQSDVVPSQSLTIILKQDMFAKYYAPEQGHIILEQI